MSGYGDGGYGGDAGSSAFLLFGRNLLESGVVTATSAAQPVTRLYDRNRTPAWAATSNAAQDIDLDTASASYSHIAVIGYSLSTGIEVYRGSSFPPSTLVTTVVSLAGDPYVIALGSTLGDRYVRVRILGGGATPSIGELFVGLPQVLALPPFIRSEGRSTLGNVRHDLSPAGYAWSTRRGVKRSRFQFAWTGMDGSDLARVEAAYDEIDQGAKKLVVQDELGRAYWMRCTTPALEPVPVGAGLYELPELAFEEAL